MGATRLERIVGNARVCSTFAGAIFCVLTCAAAADSEAERTAPHASVEAVVIAFSARYHEISRATDREFIGAVVATAAGYVGVAEPGRRGHDRIRLRCALQPGERLVALWHTHGAPGYARELFSPTDTRLADRTDVPLYLTTPAGEIRVLHAYRPVRVMRDRARRVLPLGAAAGNRIAVAWAAD